MSCLAGVLAEQGKLEEAEKLLKRATAIMDETLSPIHPHRADCLRNGGEFYRQKGDRDRAEEFFQQSLAAWAKTPAKTIREARTHFLLGRLYAEQKTSADAERCYQRALEAYQEAIGTMIHPEIAQVLEAQAGVYRATERTQQADKLVRQAIEIRNEHAKNNPIPNE